MCQAGFARSQGPREQRLWCGAEGSAGLGHSLSMLAGAFVEVLGELGSLPPQAAVRLPAERSQESSALQGVIQKLPGGVIQSPWWASF